jgi:hypothetical protein
MKLSGPIVVRLVLYAILLIMALVIRHRLQNRPSPPTPPPSGPYEIVIEPVAPEPSPPP